MFTIVGLLACLCLANAAITPYLGNNDPKDEKVLALHYTATVTAGQNEPHPYGSKLYIESQLLAYNHGSDNIFEYTYMKFHNVKHAEYNGPNNDSFGKTHILADDLKAIEAPFILVKHQTEEFAGIHFQKNEPAWSKNIKKSLASKFIINKDEKYISHNHAGHIKEETIHGLCKMDLSVYTKKQNGKMLHYIKKFYEPAKCSKFYLHSANNGRSTNYKAEHEGDLISIAEKVSEFETLNDNTIEIKKIYFHEKFNYLPWQSKSAGIQFIETNQTIEFTRELIKKSDLDLPTVDIAEMSVLELWNFDNSEFMGLDKELYFGFHQLKPSDVVPTVKNLLLATIEYLKDNHINEEKTDPKYHDVIGKLRTNMKLLDTESIWNIYNDFNVETEKGSMSRKIFLEVLPHVGTKATWHFVKHLIMKNKMPDEKTTIKILNQLALYTENPTEDFAMEMKDFLNFGKEISLPVHRAAVLCYSILLDTTFSKFNYTSNSFHMVLNDIYKTITEESTYELKIAHIMALKNVKSGYANFFGLSSSKNISATYDECADPKKLEQSRIAIMWAVAASRFNKESVYEYFWPILVNETEPLPIRITAYEQLVTRNPSLNMELLMQVHSLMAEEKDEHLFHYHYTTLQFMSESKDPCMESVSKMMRQVLRITQKREVTSSSISSAGVFDYFDNVYGHGKSIKMAIGVNDNSGLPQIGYYEETTSNGRKTRLNKGYYWNVDGFSVNSLLKLFTHGKISRELVLEEGGIANKQIRNILKNTHGHQTRNNKPIHIELWTVTNGYVNDIKIFNEDTLQEFIRDITEEYKPDSILDVEKLNRNWLDISYLNHYEGIVSTDLGLPVLFYNAVPSLSYVKIKPTIAPSRTSITASLEFETKYHRHITYKMGFYNPFADLTHSVARHVSIDASFPIQITASLNLENRSFKIILPRLSENKFSTGGLKIYSVDQVEIENDINNTLTSHCSNCKHIHEISNVQDQGRVESIVHSSTTGLEYKTAIFECDNYDMPGEEYKELFRIFTAEQNNIKHEPGMELYLNIDHALVNFFNNPYTSKCGALMKVSPSKVYPTSHIEMNWRFKMEKDQKRTKLDIRGSIDTKAEFTKETTRYWKMNINTDFSDTLHDVKLHFTKVVLGEEKNHQICFHATKKWPFMLEQIIEKPVTVSLFDLSMGYSSEDKCVYDDTFIKITVLGKHSEQQKEHMKYAERFASSCFKNALNSFNFNSDKLFDWTCLRDTIEATTLRQYNVKAKYQNVPNELVANLVFLEDSILRYSYFPHLSYKPNHTESGTVEASVTYSVDSKYLNFTVMYPTYSYEATGVEFQPEAQREMDANVILDNIAFSPLKFLANYYKKEIRPCIAHSNEVINDLNQVIPMDFKDWTLMYGEYEFMTYAVFAKEDTGNKVAARVYLKEHVLELTHKGVTFNGDVINDYDSAMVSLPATSIINNGRSIVTLRKVHKLFTVVDVDNIFKVKIIYTPYNVIVLPQTTGDKTIDGICGHLGTTVSNQQHPLVYSSL